MGLLEHMLLLWSSFSLATGSHRPDDDHKSVIGVGLVVFFGVFHWIIYLGFFWV